jgi:hypothetical protein
MTPYADTVRKAVKEQMKRQKKQRKEQNTTTAQKSAAAQGIEARVQRIVGLQKDVVRKRLSDEERRGVAGELLREKLATHQEIAMARAGQQAAIAAAQGRSINSGHGPHDPRAQVRSVYAGDYRSESPERSATELPSQVVNHAGNTETITDLAKALRRSTDPLERDRISQDLTFERLRAYHRAAGR